MNNNVVAADELRLLIERIERIEEEIKAAQEDRKAVYSEAKSRGFCSKTMKRIVALRKLDDNDRRELEAMLDVYKGALGMLDGTPLGTWAVEKLKKDETAKRGEPKSVPPESIEQQVPEPDAPAMTVDDAKRLGAEAARAGQSVTANPFPPRDARRAAWDEAWCRELGTDGMDIPEALRPAGRKPKADEQPGDAHSSADELDQHPKPQVDLLPETAIDPAYGSAVDRVQHEQYASVSKIQKWFEIGYNRAARIIEQMERDGLVSKPLADGKRQVLVDELGRPK